MNNIQVCIKHLFPQVPEGTFHANLYYWDNEDASGIKGAKYRFPLQDGTWDFSGDAVAGKGLIL